MFFVLCIHSHSFNKKKKQFEFHYFQVYIQMRLLPNLVFASKMICTARKGNQTLSSSMSSSDLVALSSNQEEVVFK